MLLRANIEKKRAWSIVSKKRELAVHEGAAGANRGDRVNNRVRVGPSTGN